MLAYAFPSTRFQLPLPSSSTYAPVNLISASTPKFFDVEFHPAEQHLRYANHMLLSSATNIVLHCLQAQSETSKSSTVSANNLSRGFLLVFTTRPVRSPLNGHSHNFHFQNLRRMLSIQPTTTLSRWRLSLWVRMLRSSV